MQFPLTIRNRGEVLVFVRIIQTAQGEVLEVENEVKPGAGPPMHVHFKQDESLTVKTGRMGYRIAGGENKIAWPGQTVHFTRGVAHRFWNAGEDLLRCSGQVTPPNNIVYFLSEIYKSMESNGGAKPGDFDAAFLLNRYRSEFAMTDIPAFVRRVIFPILLVIGKLTGKHKKFFAAPEPL